MRPRAVPPVRSLIALTAALLAALVFGPASAQQAGLQPIPAYSARVVDTIGMLQPDEKARLEAKLRTLEERKGSQIAVLLIDSTRPEEMEQYSIRVADAWKVGRKKVDDGAILIVARDDRSMRIEVGRGLEGALTDLVSNRIIDETVKPAFRAGEYATGIEAGVDRMIGVIDGEPLPPPDPLWSERVGGKAKGVGGVVAFVALGVALLLGLAISAAKGRTAQALSSGGSLGVMGLAFTGSLVFALLLALFGVFVGGLGGSGGIGGYHSRGRRGPWDGGFGGGGFGGGGFGGGGFGGGGGGGFGGGGASGRW